MFAWSLITSFDGRPPGLSLLFLVIESKRLIMASSDLCRGLVLAMIMLSASSPAVRLWPTTAVRAQQPDFCSYLPRAGLAHGLVEQKVEGEGVAPIMEVQKQLSRVDLSAH